MTTATTNMAPNGLSRIRKRLGGYLLTVTVLFAGALLWEGAARLAGSFFFPPLSAIFERMSTNWFSGPVQELFTTPEFRTIMFDSLRRLIPSFLVGSFVGLVVGVMIGLVPVLRQIFYPVIHFMRSVPAIAMIPLFIVLLGLGDAMKMWMIGSAVIWPVLINVVQGTRSVDPLMTDTLRSYGATFGQRIRWLVLPSITPYLFAGLRIATMIALAVMVVSEMLASGSGIGHLVLYSQRRFNTLDMWAGVLVLGAIGILFNTALVALEKRMLDWHIARNAHHS